VKRKESQQLPVEPVDRFYMNPSTDKKNLTTCIY
jgi:hypothetical protein